MTHYTRILDCQEETQSAKPNDPILRLISFRKRLITKSLPNDSRLSPPALRFFSGTPRIALAMGNGNDPPEREKR